MIKKNFEIILLIILLFTFSVKADVPPQIGYVRVSNNLVTETEEDLSDNRFFLDFGGDLKEVAIKSKGRTEIPLMGGGARYRIGTFLAIPKKALSGFGEKLSEEQLDNLSQSIKAKKIDGVVELAEHRFLADIPIYEEPAEVYYVIKREADTLKAEQKTVQKSFATSRIGLIAGGILITLAAVIAGVFVFRKVSKKV